MDSRIAVVIGSTRPTRVCAGTATRVADAALPLLDEPLMAAPGQDEHEHTRAWSRTLRDVDATLRPTLPQVRTVDAQPVAALSDRP